ncbi:MAG: TolC family protein [Candidatus Acidiferrales bacterium]
MKMKKWIAPILLIAFAFSVSHPLRAQEPEKLSLSRAVTLALKNSRDLTLARIQYNTSLRQAGVDRAEFLPNLFTGSGAAYSSGFPQTPDGGPPSVFSLSYTQALFNPPLRGQLRAAEDRSHNQLLEVDRTRDAVILRTAAAYLELAKVRHSLELLRTERESAAKILGVTRERISSGLELPIEETRNELEQAKIERRIIQLESRDQILTDQLRDLCGFPADQAIEVSPEDLPADAAAPSGDLVEMAVASSPLVKEAENERSAREHIWKGERGAYWPTIGLIGQYSVFSRVNNYQEFYKTFQRNNVNVGAEIRIPLFASKTHVDIAEAKSELEFANLSVGKVRHDVRVDAQLMIRALREADASREVARLDLKLAQENLALVQSRFDQGRSTLRELELARLDESEKWVAFLDADFARQQAQLELLRSTGQLAQVFH